MVILTVYSNSRLADSLIRLDTAAKGGAEEGFSSKKKKKKKRKEAGLPAVPEPRLQALVKRTESKPDPWQSGSWLVHCQPWWRRLS